MTEKRLIVDEDYNWVDTTTGMGVEVEDAFDLVNELADENEDLKKENEQLRKLTKIMNTNAKDIVDVLNGQENRIWKLKEENEQLKQRMDDVLTELYCKDRKLEELGIDIECCDKKGDVE